MFRLYVEQQVIRPQLYYPQRRQVSSFKGHEHAKKIQEESLKATERIQAKTDSMKIVLNGPRKPSVREEVRAAFKHESDKNREKGKEEHPFPLPMKREDVRKGTKKEIPKGKDPKVPVGHESQTSGYATFSEGTVAKRICMRLLAPTSMLTLQIQKWMQMVDTCVFKHTGKAGKHKTGNATLAILLL